MSTHDTIAPLLSAPWFDADGGTLPVRPLPGLHPEVIENLESTYPGTLSPAMKSLLGTCCGLAGTQLGSIDFTGCWYPEESCAVFRPALTLAVDYAGRRWIAKIGDKDLPGPIWCMFSQPEVAVYVSDDLAKFMATLRERTCAGGMQALLNDIAAQARTVWALRQRLAIRPHKAYHIDPTIKDWLIGLPLDAYVYDLRSPRIARGWPYGVAGPSGRLYRCGRLAVFAVAGSPAEGWRATSPRARIPIPEAPASAEISFAIETAVSRHERRSKPGRSARRPPGRRVQAWEHLSAPRRSRLELPPCA
jgi:hypothetical protein